MKIKTFIIYYLRTLIFKLTKNKNYYLHTKIKRRKIKLLSNHLNYRKCGLLLLLMMMKQ